MTRRRSDTPCCERSFETVCIVVSPNDGGRYARSRSGLFYRAQSLSRVSCARLRLAPDVVVDGRDAEGDVELRPPRETRQDIDVAHDHRAAGDHRRRVRKIAESLQALAREPVPAFGWLVGVCRRADHHRLFAPGATRQLAPQDGRDVGFDPDRPSVATVRWTISAKLKRPDVTEGAAVLAAGIRVERPGEAHVLSGVER